MTDTRSYEMTVDVADALDAVAAVDDTRPDILVTLIVGDWLHRHAPRFRTAAAALDRLIHAEERALTDDVDEPEEVADEVAGELEQDPPDMGGGDGEASPPTLTYPCAEDGCGFVGKSKQSLGGHRSSKHRARRPDMSPATVTRIKAAAQQEGHEDDSQDSPPDPASTALTCPLCGKPTANPKHLRGVGDLCPSCHRTVA